MGLLPRTLGVVQAPPGVMSASSWMNALSDEWFLTQTAFVCNVLQSPIAPDKDHSSYSPLLRTIMIFMRFGLLQVVHTCPKCKRKAILAERSRDTSQHKYWVWTCPKSGHHHFKESLACEGSLLEKIKQNSWPAFLNFISLLRLENHSLHVIAEEIVKAHGSHNEKTLRGWRVLYQDKLKIVNIKKGHLKIGAPSEVVVIDETVVGIHDDDGFESLAPKGIGKYAPAVRTSTRRRAAVRKRILKRLPARTIWKRSASKSVVKKKPAANAPAARKKPAGVTTSVVKKKPAAHAITARKKPAGVLKRPAGQKDARANGKWLWAGVTVGRGTEVFNHDNGKKRFTFCFLPKRSEASHNKPRGLQEIKKVIQKFVAKGSILVFDKWKSTVSAVQQLGFRHAPPINHSVEFRSRETGFHANDIESENHRLKHFSRIRNGRLMLNELDLHEYAFYINVGKDMPTILKALAV